MNTKDNKSMLQWQLFFLRTSLRSFLLSSPISCLEIYMNQIKSNIDGSFRYPSCSAPAIFTRIERHLQNHITLMLLPSRNRSSRDRLALQQQAAYSAPYYSCSWCICKGHYMTRPLGNTIHSKDNILCVSNSSSLLLSPQKEKHIQQYVSSMKSEERKILKHQLFQ